MKTKLGISTDEQQPESEALDGRPVGLDRSKDDDDEPRGRGGAPPAPAEEDVELGETSPHHIASATVLNSWFCMQDQEETAPRADSDEQPAVGDSAQAEAAGGSPSAGSANGEADEDPTLPDALKEVAAKDLEAGLDKVNDRIDEVVDKGKDEALAAIASTAGKDRSRPLPTSRPRPSRRGSRPPRRSRTARRSSCSCT